MNHSYLKYTLPFALLGVATAASIAKVASNVEALAPVKVAVPAVGDTANAPHRYSDIKLLEAADRAHSKEARIALQPADTTGFISLQRPAEGKAIETLFTSLRPERYIKGTLKISSASVFEVMVDGKSSGKKEKPDSAINLPAGTVDVPIALEPERSAEIIVKVLTDRDAAADPKVKIEFVPEKKFEDVLFALAPEKSHRFSIYDMSDGPRARFTRLSPDGKYLIVSYSEVFSAKDVRSWAELFDTKSGKIIDANLEYNANWMPTGSTLYYTVKRGGEYDLVSVEMPTRKSTVVASHLPSDNIIWSPDASYFIYPKNIEGEAKTGIMKRYSTPDDRIPGYRDRSYLMKYDMASGVATPLTYGGASTAFADFNADGSKMLYMAAFDTPDTYPFYKTDLIQLDMRTLKTDTIVRADGELANAVYSPDGKRIFLVGGPNLFGNLGVNAGNHPIANDFDMQGYIFDIASKDAKPMTRDFDPSITGIPVWNKRDGNIYFRAKQGFFTPIFSLNPATGKISSLPVATDNTLNFSMGDNEAEWIAYTGQGYEYAGKAYIINLKSGKSTLVADPNAERIAKVDFGKTSQWTFTASDGTLIDGTMCLPPNFDPNKKYPLIVYYYGGTTPSERAMSHAYIPQLFASRDYVVYIVNPSGTIGYGQEFSARHVNAWGKQTAEDIIQGVKEFCKQHPFVDSKKIGCLGASYGGFMTMYLQTLTDIFAAAVSHAGISNVTSYWGEGFWGYSYNSVAAAKSYPWSDPELFTRQGALFNADKIHTPLLLLHGSEDTNVPIGESIQLFNALKVLGRDVEFITVEGANHVITDYDKRILWHATIMAWFARWLQDDPRWWDALYSEKK